MPADRTAEIIGVVHTGDLDGADAGAVNVLAVKNDIGGHLTHLLY
jgi:hypothetical protein